MKIPIIYGITLGVFISTWVLIGYSLTWYTSSLGLVWLTPFTFVIQIAVLFHGIYDLKKKKYKGQINYGNALLGGIVITFLLAFIFSISTFIYFNNNNNKIRDYALSEMKKDVYQSIKPSEKINQDITKKLQNYIIGRRSNMILTGYEPENQGKSAFIERFIIGFFFSLIFATILRKRDSTPDVIMKA